jgi:GTPase SAR1 family protein
MSSASVGSRLTVCAIKRSDNGSSGQTGLGKSTLINTIFASHLIDSKGRLRPDEPVRSTTEIQTVSHIIEENGVRLRLNIVDTPGYGDQVNNERWLVPWLPGADCTNNLAAGIQLSSISKTSIQLTYEKSLRPSVNAISKIHESTAVSSSSNPLDTR